MNLTKSDKHFCLKELKTLVKKELREKGKTKEAKNIYELILERFPYLMVYYFGIMVRRSLNSIQQKLLRKISSRATQSITKEKTYV